MPVQPQQQAPTAGLAAPGNTALIQLRNLTTDDLRSRLEKLLVRPLPVNVDATGAWQAFPVEATPGVGVVVSVKPTTREVRVDGPASQVAAWQSVITALDSPASSADGVTQLVATKPASHDRVRKALSVLQTQGVADGSIAAKLTAMMQPKDAAAAPANPPAPAAGQAETNVQVAPGAAQTAIDAAQLAEAAGGLLGPVQVEFVEGLDVIVLRGAERDVQRVMEIINQIEQLSAVTVPLIEILPLKNLESVQLAALLNRLYTQVLAARVGEVSITPLGKPNALLIIGRKENVQMAMELIQRLDQPALPTGSFQVFPLKHASAEDAKMMIDEFLGQEETTGTAPPATTNPNQPLTLAAQALVVADSRTNSLIVSAGPRDLAEIAALIERIDSAGTAAVDQVRVFPLRNAIASEMAQVLESAIQTQSSSGRSQSGAAGQPGSSNNSSSGGGRASSLEFMTIGSSQPLQSGILSDVRITAEPRGNAIIVTAPAESMELIAALIEQLDHAPNVTAELKVFTLNNGDASSLVDMLRSLFSAPEDGGGTESGGVSQGGLARLQFSVDARTNSIIAAGSREDLAVVEAILLRLDEGDIRERVNIVYRLKNAAANDVATSLNNWLQGRQNAQNQAAVTVSPFEQIEQEVIIVPEFASNSLIVSATPRYYKEIEKLIVDLDERPPMVMIQVLIAEVRLNDTDEFGVELGLQDSVLFDRSLVSDLQTLTTTTTNQVQGTAVTTEQQSVINLQGNPGFNFNNQPLGNNLSTAALATAAKVGTQGLSSFGLNRVNSDLGFGGFVFSASSSGVNVLLRALQEKRRLEVLSRPQVMALDGQLGQVRVGQRVPRFATTSLTEFGQQNSIVYEEVGLILQVLPRISPDGLVVMQISAEKSEVGSEAEGIPISISNNGQVLRTPRIDATTAITTVQALSGQTVVLSGLLTSRKFDIHRRVPLLADIPLVGDLFRFDSVQQQRTELLIILTPRIVNGKQDAEIIKQIEASRMSWVVCDAVALHGDGGLRSRCDTWGPGDAESVFPNFVPQEGDLPQMIEGQLQSDGPTLESPTNPTPPPEPLPPGQPLQSPPPAMPLPPQTNNQSMPANRYGEVDSAVSPARFSQKSVPSDVNQVRYQAQAPTRLPQTSAR